ncbi:MAG: hypothetical protein CVT66_06205 [Actinobacteria bacterium HGW-Actinobacteria-6]|nr:MAG: hypothetical protein CVT66_06205 [Actinobacteria bacterium HGW-Actinobacteria-6]
MGARLVSLALNPAWSNLTPPARLAFITMCHTARDKDAEGIPARTYWAGHDYLAVVLAGEETDAARQRVKRAIAELIAAGAIERIGTAHRARQMTYLVQPDAWPNQPRLNAAAD